MRPSAVADAAPAPSPKRIVIIGGVAGGASCATRARRLCERCEILLIERGRHVSFANCGLPYYVGDVIASEERLLVATPQLFRDRFNIEVRLGSEVIEIQPALKSIRIRDIESGQVVDQPYDALVIATGALPVIPPIPGIDLPGIHVLRTIPDSRKIRQAVEHTRRALVVGGGMIGLEMVENLVHRGLEVTLVERAPQILPVLDAEMALYVEERLQAEGVRLHLEQSVDSFEQQPDGELRAHLNDGSHLDAGVVILGIGVHPNSSLAREAGLKLTPRGAIEVDATLRSSDPHIWAVGDVVASDDIVTHAREPMPLAGPANRQGRIAASNLLAGESEGACQMNRPPMRFRGVQGTAVCEVFGLTVATTGASERTLQRLGLNDYQAIYLHPGNHASYFPGARPIHLKLLFSVPDGRILGAQAVGEADVARRIDVIAMALQMRGSVFDLEEAELCYAPQYGSAKDPVNMAGMIASNHLRGDLSLADWGGLGEAAERSITIVDVRSAEEFERGHISGAISLPLESLRARIDELSGHPRCWLVCGVGQRAYYAQRILRQNGVEASILSGGMQTWATLAALRTRSE